MNQHIKKILILFPLTLLLSGCGIGGMLALSKLFAGLGKVFLSIMGIFRVGRVSSQNPEATGQVIFMILLISGIAGVIYYFNKKQKGKPITKTTTATTIEAKQENIPKEKLSSDETPKVEEKKAQPQQERAGVKIGYWLAKNLENFKNSNSFKVKSPNEKKEQETKIEIKKKEPKKEDQKPEEVTITPQEEESIYEQVAKELKENRSEGVWLKAYTENDGDEAKTKIAYTKKRVTALMEELKVKKEQ